jgi:glycosyltransferase involved in cell wall biosynthesis
MSREKIHYIPNWATLSRSVRPLNRNSRYRQVVTGRFLVGLSGNLGFTHDPEVVFDAARLLREERDIHFLLSGWGIGFERLKLLQSEEKLSNVTLVERVEDRDLEEFLSVANLWIIPYRKGVAGVSVPSRFYNLLAVGRPVIVVSEPEAEAALTVLENNIGWVVPPGESDELANAILLASHLIDSSMAERAVSVAEKFDINFALSRYSELVQELSMGQK